MSRKTSSRAPHKKAKAQPPRTLGEVVAQWDSLWDYFEFGTMPQQLARHDLRFLGALRPDVIAGTDCVELITRPHCRDAQCLAHGGNAGVRSPKPKPKARLGARAEWFSSGWCMDDAGQWVREVEPGDDNFASLTPEQWAAVDRALAKERAKRA
jgi:hypothetical protein